MRTSFAPQRTPVPQPVQAPAAHQEPPAPRHPMLMLQDRVGNRAVLDAIASGIDPMDVFPHDGILRRHLGAELPGDAVVDPAGCAARGVEAFTDGTTTHFRDGRPRLAVAAHEAAHQLQHAGLTRDAGLGAEHHAEAIAGRVLSGLQAIDLLGDDGAAVSGQHHTYLQIPVAQQGPGSELGWTSPEGGDLKVSDDGHLAVPDAGDRASRLAWATAADITRANATLEGQGSKVRLKAGAVALRGKAPDGDASRPEMELSRVILTEADGSQPVALAGDCGKAAYEVMGAYDDGYLGAAVVQTPSGEATTDPHPYQSRVDGQPESVGTTELWFREILTMAYGPLPTDQLIARYQAQSPEERAAFDARWGINQQAIPEVGEAVTTMSLRDAPDWAPTAEDNFAWNWHFAACVLASGGDYITLENFTGAPDGNWYFSMYGPARYSQSFYAREVATNTFGTEAVTMVVRPESRVRLTLDLAENPDTLASAELYVRLCTPAGVRTSEPVSVAPGEPGSVLVSLADLIVNGASQPIQIDVFDADLLDDEHLATVTWLPPFNPTQTVENGVTIAGEMIP